MSFNKQEVIVFRKTIAGSASGLLKERIKDNGVITGIQATFYRGQEKKLKVYPNIIYRNGGLSPLLSYPDDGDDHIAGDDETIFLDIEHNVQKDDYVQVNYVNTDTDPCSLVLYAFVSYKRGE